MYLSPSTLHIIIFIATFNQSQFRFKQNRMYFQIQTLACRNSIQQSLGQFHLCLCTNIQFPPFAMTKMIKWIKFFSFISFNSDEISVWNILGIGEFRALCERSWLLTIISAFWISIEWAISCTIARLVEMKSVKFCAHSQLIRSPNVEFCTRRGDKDVSSSFAEQPMTRRVAINAANIGIAIR